MKPIVFDEARSAALDALVRIRNSEATRALVLDLVNSMVAAYQAKIGDCPGSEVEAIRTAMAQMRRIRSGLTEQNLKSVGLFVP